MRSVEEIQAEINQVETELEQAKSTLVTMERENDEVAKEQATDPMWKAARLKYIQDGDMSEVNNWHNRRNTEKERQRQYELQKEAKIKDAAEKEKTKKALEAQLRSDIELKQHDYNIAASQNNIAAKGRLELELKRAKEIYKEKTGKDYVPTETNPNDVQQNTAPVGSENPAAADSYENDMAKSRSIEGNIKNLLETAHVKNKAKKADIEKTINGLKALNTLINDANDPSSLAADKKIRELQGMIDNKETYEDHQERVEAEKERQKKLDNAAAAQKPATMSDSNWLKHIKEKGVLLVDPKDGTKKKMKKTEKGWVAAGIDELPKSITGEYEEEPGIYIENDAVAYNA